MLKRRSPSWGWAGFVGCGAWHSSSVPTRSGDVPSTALPTPEPLVEARGLGRTYDDVVAVRGLSFTVQRGEVVGFLGHNGAGKSTTMRMLAGALVPSEGQARIAGRDASSLEARRHVGFLPEMPPLTAELSVEEQLRFVAGLRGAARDDIDRALERCELTQQRRKLCGTLSRGTRQRVGLAQALLGDPAVLLLDEPTAGLDPRQVAGVRELVRELAATRAILLSTHILGEVTALCSRVLLLREGTLVLDRSLADLRAQGRPLEQIVLASLAGTFDADPSGAVA